MAAKNLIQIYIFHPIIISRTGLEQRVDKVRVCVYPWNCVVSFREEVKGQLVGSVVVVAANPRAGLREVTSWYPLFRRGLVQVHHCCW